MLGYTQIGIDYSVSFLKVEYVLVKPLFESGSRCPLSYHAVDGAGSKRKTSVEIMNKRIKKIFQCRNVQFSV